MEKELKYDECGKFKDNRRSFGGGKINFDLFLSVSSARKQILTMQCICEWAARLFNLTAEEASKFFGLLPFCVCVCPDPILTSH